MLLHLGVPWSFNPTIPIFWSILKAWAFLHSSTQLLFWGPDWKPWILWNSGAMHLYNMTFQFTPIYLFSSMEISQKSKVNEKLIYLSWCYCLINATTLIWWSFIALCSCSHLQTHTEANMTSVYHWWRNTTSHRVVTM
jgi:hypothetical protein